MFFLFAAGVMTYLVRRVDRPLLPRNDPRRIVARAQAPPGADRSLLPVFSYDKGYERSRAEEDLHHRKKITDESARRSPEPLRQNQRRRHHSDIGRHRPGWSEVRVNKVVASENTESALHRENDDDGLGPRGTLRGQAEHHPKAAKTSRTDCDQTRPSRISGAVIPQRARASLISPQAEPTAAIAGPRVPHHTRPVAIRPNMPLQVPTPPHPAGSGNGNVRQGAALAVGHS